MLRTPHFGWVDVFVNNKHLGTASYIDYVPELILEECFQRLDNEKARFNIEFDGEGYHFGLIEIGQDIYTYDDCGKNEPFIRIHDCLTKECQTESFVKHLIREVTEDIKDNFDEWIDWDVFVKDDQERSRKKLKSILNKAEEYL